MWLVLAMVFLCCPCLCMATPTASLMEDEWTWMADDVATLKGEIIPDSGFIGPMVLKLSMEVEGTTAEAAGEVVFTQVGEKKLTIRKQTDTYTATIEEGSSSLTFSASWFLPESLEGLHKVTFTLEVQDENEKLLCTASLTKSMGGIAEGGLTETLAGMTRYIVIASLLLMAAAIIRNRILYRKRAQNHKAAP